MYREREREREIERERERGSLSVRNVIRDPSSNPGLG